MPYAPAVPAGLPAIGLAEDLQNGLLERFPFGDVVTHVDGMACVLTHVHLIGLVTEDDGVMHTRWQCFPLP